MDNQIEIRSSVTIKASPDCKPIKHKAIAGFSDAQLIERHTIGEYNNEEEKGKEEKEADSD